ncbi:hypothetical protein [Actinomadura hibisca]|uniref:hypothetical protein n=1 Tax=Actinomadura hibisca TaxID=68565 RepID=UPI000829B2DF|nr:hypothetical protein [Actinomadura hibisca]
MVKSKTPVKQATPAAKTAPAKRATPSAAKAAPAVRPCQCSADCTATTRRTFAPGHDARMVGRLGREAAERVASGSLDVEAATLLAVNTARETGASALLVEKVRASADRLASRAQAKAARAQATAPAKGTEVRVSHGKRSYPATVDRHGHAQHQLGKATCTHKPGADGEWQ